VTFQFNDSNQDYQYQAGEETPGSQTVNLPTNVQIKRVSGGALVSPANAAGDIIMFDHIGLLRDSNWVYVTPPFVIVVQWPSLTSSCISVSSNRIREGTLNGTTCTEK
jgi:hypothetical protein